MQRFPLSRLAKWTLAVGCLMAVLSEAARAQVPAGLGSDLANPHKVIANLRTPPMPAPPVPPSLATLIRSGWVQIVRFEQPAGATIEIASNSGVVRLLAPANIGLALGKTYYLRVSNIPEKEGLTVYPTLQLIGYTMPPANVDPLDYPIPVHILTRDCEEAAGGKFVSNVVYLEDPISALPMAFPRGEIPVVDTAAGESPLSRASSMGRPMVFLQLGNRTPLDDQIEASPGDPAVFVLPENILAPENNPASDIQHAGWQRLPGPAAWPAIGSLGRPSSQACMPNQSVVRLPYKIHPRMPHDEYLCDGGDQVPYAYVTGHHDLAGLGTGETVAQFSRPGEKPRLVTSGQVCVYAPRFGLVRSSAVSVSSLQMEGPQGVAHRLRRGAIEGRATAASRSQKEKIIAIRRREQLVGMVANEPLAALDEMRVISAVHQKEGFDKVFSQIGPNNLLAAADPRIAASIEATKSWNRDQFPMYSAITEGGGQVTGTMQTGEVQQVKEPNLRPGDLVITKTVTTENAQQGDVIEFAIYYRNIGQRPIESVSIIDSLTARLEWVRGSEKSDHRAVFSASFNDAESHELRWDISDAVPAGQGGVVWFKTKVR